MWNNEGFVLDLLTSSWSIQPWVFINNWCLHVILISISISINAKSCRNNVHISAKSCRNNVHISHIQCDLNGFIHTVVILLQQEGQHFSDLYLGWDRACAFVLRVLRELERKGALIANALVLLCSYYDTDSRITT